MGDAEENLEEQYENVTLNEPKTVQRSLLPIKTKTSIIQQAVVKNEKGTRNKVEILKKLKSGSFKNCSKMLLNMK